MTSALLLSYWIKLSVSLERGGRRSVEHVTALSYTTCQDETVLDHTLLNTWVKHHQSCFVSDTIKALGYMIDLDLVPILNLSLHFPLLGRRKKGGHSHSSVSGSAWAIQWVSMPLLTGLIDPWSVILRRIGVTMLRVTGFHLLLSIWQCCCWGVRSLIGWQNLSNDFGSTPQISHPTGLTCLPEKTMMGTKILQ